MDRIFGVQSTKTQMDHQDFPINLMRLFKAIKIAHKGDWAKHEEEWNDIEGILGITKNLPDDVSGPRADDA